MKNMKALLNSTLLFITFNVNAVDPDTHGKELLQADLKETQQKLNAALENYKNPDCLKRLFYGNAKCKNIYALFIECVKNPAACKRAQEYPYGMPSSLCHLAEQVYNAQWRVNYHTALTQNIKTCEVERFQLTRIFKFRAEQKSKA